VHQHARFATSANTIIPQKVPNRNLARVLLASHKHNSTKIAPDPCYDVLGAVTVCLLREVSFDDEEE